MIEGCCGEILHPLQSYSFNLLEIFLGSVLIDLGQIGSRVTKMEHDPLFPFGTSSTLGCIVELRPDAAIQEVSVCCPQYSFCHTSQFKKFVPEYAQNMNE